MSSEHHGLCLWAFDGYYNNILELSQKKRKTFNLKSKSHSSVFPRQYMNNINNIHMSNLSVYLLSLMNIANNVNNIKKIKR